MNQNLEPLVSLVVPAYNNERFVNSFIECIMNIQYTNIELIVTDDCSKDNTYKLFKDNYDLLCTRFVNVVLNKNVSNKGIPANINGILEFIKGKYVKIIAVDDILLKDSIGSLVDFYEKNQDAVFIYSNAYIVNDGFELGKDYLKKYKTIYTNKQDTNSLFYERLFLKNIVSAPTVMIKKSTIDEFGPFDVNCFCEDIPYWLKVSYNRPVKYLDEITACYRRTKKPKNYRLSIDYCKKMFFENKFLLNTYINRIYDGSYKKKIIVDRISRLYYYKKHLNDDVYNLEYKQICKKYKVSSFMIKLHCCLNAIKSLAVRCIKKILRLEYEV